MKQRLLTWYYGPVTARWWDRHYMIRTWLFLRALGVLRWLQARYDGLVMLRSLAMHYRNWRKGSLLKEEWQGFCSFMFDCAPTGSIDEAVWLKLLRMSH